MFNSGWHDLPVALSSDFARTALLKRGCALEYTTLGWNVVGVVILAVAVLVGLTLSVGLGWWWADTLAGYVLFCNAAHEARHIFSEH
jgi:hypothetical protein